MTIIKGEVYLDEAFKDVDEVNARVFHQLDSDDVLFDEYQPRIVGVAALIDLYRKDLLPKVKTEEEETRVSEEIITEVTNLEHTLDVFDRSCPDTGKLHCQLAREKLKAFLNANLGLFPKTKEGEDKNVSNQIQDRQQKGWDKGQ